MDLKNKPLELEVSKIKRLVYYYEGTIYNNHMLTEGMITYGEVKKNIPTKNKLTFSRYISVGAYTRDSYDELLEIYYTTFLKFKTLVAKEYPDDAIAIVNQRVEDRTNCFALVFESNVK